MADKRTSEMVQRRAEYVPEELRPEGALERAGWYMSNIPDALGKGQGPWSIADKEYDTKPFGADIGVDKTMEFILRELLLGNSAKAAREAVDKKKKEELERELKAQQAGWVGESNRDSNRFGAQGDFDR